MFRTINLTYVFRTNLSCHEKKSRMYSDHGRNDYGDYIIEILSLYQLFICYHYITYIS